MPAYHIQEATFQLPEVLKDKTVNIFSLTQSGPSEFNIVISRDELKRGMTLSRYADSQVNEMKAKFPGFELILRRDTTVGKTPAFQLDYIWRSDKTVLFQRQYVLAVSPQGVSSPYVLMVTATSQDTLGKWEQTFAEFMAGFDLR